MEMAGERPSMESTSGFSICSRNCRAYAESDSTYRRCPSAKIVSKASDDLPDPDTPVMTTNLLRGTTTSMFLRLCSLAPRMTMDSMWSDPNAASLAQCSRLRLVEGSDPNAAPDGVNRPEGDGQSVRRRRQCYCRQRVAMSLPIVEGSDPDWREL